jgi:hypothetical protein
VYASHIDLPRLSVLRFVYFVFVAIKAVSWFLKDKAPDKNFSVFAADDDQRAETIRGWFHTLVTMEKSQCKYFPSILQRYRASIDHQGSVQGSSNRFKIFLSRFEGDARSLASIDLKDQAALVKELGVVQTITQKGCSTDTNALIDKGLIILDKLRSVWADRIVDAIRTMRYEDAGGLVISAKPLLKRQSFQDLTQIVRAGKLVHALRGARMAEYPADHSSAFALIEGTTTSYMDAKSCFGSGLTLIEGEMHEPLVMDCFKELSISFEALSDSFDKWGDALAKLCKTPDFQFPSEHVQMSGDDVNAARIKYDAWWVKVNRIKDLGIYDHVIVDSADVAISQAILAEAAIVQQHFRAALVRPGALVGPKFEFRHLKTLAAFFWVDGKSINYHPDAYTGIDLAGLLSQEFHGIVVKHFVTGKPIDASVIKRELDSLVVGVVSQRPHADYAKCCSEFNLQMHDACKDECDKLIVALRAWAPGDDVGWGCVSKLEAQITSSGIATCQMTLALASATRRDEMKKATATIDHLQDRLGSIIGIISHASTIMPGNIVRNGKSIPLCDAVHDLVGQVQSEHDAYGRAFDLCSSLVPLLEGFIEKGERMSPDSEQDIMKVIARALHPESCSSTGANGFLNVIARVASFLVDGKLVDYEGIASSCSTIAGGGARASSSGSGGSCNAPPAVGADVVAEVVDAEVDASSGTGVSCNAQPAVGADVDAGVVDAEVDASSGKGVSCNVPPAVGADVVAGVVDAEVDAAKAVDAAEPPSKKLKIGSPLADDALELPQLTPNFALQYPENIAGITVPQLKELCRKVGLPIDGNKSMLVARLEAQKAKA